MPEISPEENEAVVIGALEQQLACHAHDYLFTVSMDHRPSEQLNDTEIHTSVLVLSCGVEHAELAKKIASEIGPKYPKLLKWSGRSQSYKRGFVNALVRNFAQYPVYIFSLSSLGEDIRASENHYLKQLKLPNIYTKTKSDSGKDVVEFGPVFREKNPSDPITVRLPEKRAIMVLHIAHYVLRIHSWMWRALRAQNKDNNYNLNWNFLADKFPGEIDGGMPHMFSTLMSLSRPTGRIVWGHFLQGNQVETDLLADNLAGAVNEHSIDPSKFPELASIQAGEDGGVFYLEKWFT